MYFCKCLLTARKSTSDYDGPYKCPTFPDFPRMGKFFIVFFFFYSKEFEEIQNSKVKDEKKCMLHRGQRINHRIMVFFIVARK